MGQRGPSDRAAQRRRHSLPAHAASPVTFQPLEGRTLLSTGQDVSFVVGPLTADTKRNIVYVADNSDLRMLALNTDGGRVVALGVLAAPATYAAVSVAGDRLFVSEPSVRTIAVLALPELTPVAEFHLDFEPGSLAAGARDCLYVYDEAGGYGDALVQLDAATGASRGRFGSDNDETSTLLRRSPNGRRLYTMNRGLSGPGDLIRAYDTGVLGRPVYVGGYDNPESNAQDFAIDDEFGRAYTMNGGVYGVGVTDIASGDQTVWPADPSLAPYGNAVSFLSSGTSVYGCSFQNIREFRRSDGKVLNDFPVDDNYSIPADGTEITPNGKLVFAAEYVAGPSDTSISRLGILGVHKLIVAGVPAARFNVVAGTAGNVAFHGSSSLPFAAGQTITRYSWEFGDGSAKSGASSKPIHAYAADGVYTVKLTVTASTGRSDEFVTTVTVANAPPPYAGTPYNGAATKVRAAGSSTLELENFDDGGEGVAYHDADPANRKHAYRPTGVDLNTLTDAGKSGLGLVYVKAGEWLKYTLDVAADGSYDLDLRLAGVLGGGKFHLEIDGVKLPTLTAPKTGAWTTYATIKQRGVSLTAGKHVLKLAFDANDSSGFVANFNWLKFTRK